MQSSTISRFETNPNDDHLDLSYKHLTSNDIPDILACLEKNPTITELDVSENEDLKDEGIKILAKGLETMSHIRTLNVRLTGIGVDGVEAIAANPFITTLNISDNEVRDEGAFFLAMNKILRSLDLTCSRIGDHGIRALMANRFLKEIFLERNDDMTTEGLRLLAANTTLQKLDVQNLFYDYEEDSNGIKDEGAKILSTTKTLISLCVEDNDVGEEMQETLDKVIEINKNIFAVYISIYSKAQYSLLESFFYPCLINIIQQYIGVNEEGTVNMYDIPPISDHQREAACSIIREFKLFDEISKSDQEEIRVRMRDDCDQKEEQKASKNLGKDYLSRITTHSMFMPSQQTLPSDMPPLPSLGQGKDPTVLGKRKAETTMLSSQDNSQRGVDGQDVGSGQKGREPKRCK